MKTWEEEMEALKTKLGALEEEIALLRSILAAGGHPVERLLWQRGLPVLSHGESPHLLLPPDAGLFQKERLFQLMRRYSFRLFARDLIQFPRGKDTGSLSRYCSKRTVWSYLRTLEDLGIIELDRHHGYGLIPSQVVSFGPTLEWYVSEVLQREFLAPALFNVRLGHTRHGGDYDVISVIAGYLTYIEVKSSPPRGIEQPSVSAFMKRLSDLKPHLAIFLVDTELRMKDKIAVLFSEALASNPASGNGISPLTVERFMDEIFHIDHSIYLMNSRKGIYSSLRVCFRDFLRQERIPGDARLSRLKKAKIHPPPEEGEER